MFLPRLPHADVKLLLFAPDAARSVKGKQTQQANTKQKQEPKEDRKQDVFVFPVSVCLMSSYVTQQLLFIK